MMGTLSWPVLLLIALGTEMGRPLPGATTGQDPPAPYHAVDVDLVLVHATVCDRQDRFVSGLPEEDFSVYEDGVSQQIRLFRNEDIAVTVGLVVDHSRSMRPKIFEVITAARGLVHSSNAEDQMFVVNFNENVTLGLPGTMTFTGNSGELERAISRGPATGMSALYDALVQALERLQEGSWDKKVLVVISDGADNASTHTLAQVLEIAGKSNAVIYTVGLFANADVDANPRVLDRLAHATGGKAFFPSELSALVAICKGIARDIRSQYTIGYVSTNAARDGRYRAIRVDAQSTGHGKLYVRNRAGYVAGHESKTGQGPGAKGGL